MKRIIIFALATVLSASLFGCSKEPVPVETPVVLKEFNMEKWNKPLVFTAVDAPADNNVPEAAASGDEDAPKSLPEDQKSKKLNPVAASAQELCNQTLAQIEVLRAKVANVQGERTVENTLAPMNDILILLERMAGVSELMSSVHPNAQVREVTEECTVKVKAASTELHMSPELYAAVKSVKIDNFDSETKRFVKLLLRDYERAGVDKDEETRAKLAALNKEITELGLEFDRNIRSARKELKVAPEDLKGLPEDFINAHPVDEDGKITLSTDYTDYTPVMTYCDSEDVRRELTILYNTRAYPENEEVFKKLLQKRNEYAKLLGYDSWAAYNTADKMAKDTKTVSSFIEDIANASRPRMEADREKLLARKKLDNPNATDFYAWDRFYYIEKLKKETNNVDSQEVRQFFPYEKVKRGVLAVASQMYGVSFQQSDMEVWDPLVEAYDVYDGSELIARFYLDMHPRQNKYSHAAAFPMISGITDLQLPAGTLVCNFPEPSPSNPGYMEHSQVETFFHEFGHLMHHLFAGRHQWANLSGIACEWDFVEAPSQLFEDWAWDYNVLKYFAVNANGEVISEDLVKRMKEADSVGLGVTNMRQIYYAALSLAYHTMDPTNMNIVDVQNQMHAKYSPFKEYEGDYTFASFGHLNGYSSGYYTYMWSLAIAKDLGTVFDAKGHMDSATAKLYREKILSVGGAKDASDMVTDFLGRPYNLDAFKKWLSE